MRPPEEHPRLSLALPPEWQSKATDSDPSLTEVAIAPNLLLEIRRLVSLPVDNAFWVESVMRRNAPPDCQLERIALENTPSDTGLPTIFAHYELRDQAGELLEERVGAFYRIIHNGAEVVVRLLDGARWSEHASTLRPVLMGGEIAWPSSESVLVYTLLGMKV